MYKITPNYFWIFVIILFSNCSLFENDSPTKPDPEDIIEYHSNIPELKLVPIGGDILNRILSKTADGADISFGDVLATKELYYLIVNSGEIPVFNVLLTTLNAIIEISPNSIGVIDPAIEGISATPIISFICPHVIPPSGVGSLFPMQVGLVEDSLEINYQYVALFDSIDNKADTLWMVGDTINADAIRYSIDADKKGVVFQPSINDTSVFEASLVNHFGIDDVSQASTVSFFNPDTIINLHINNNGNEPIEYQLVIQIYRMIADTTISLPNGNITPGSYIDLDIVNDYYADYPPLDDGGGPQGIYSISIDFGPTPFIIGYNDHLFLDGRFHMWIELHYHFPNDTSGTDSSFSF